MKTVDSVFRGLDLIGYSTSGTQYEHTVIRKTDTGFLPNQQTLIESQSYWRGHFIVNCVL